MTIPTVLVSVILPVYNEEKHIAHVLDSLLLQVRCGWDIEILVIDGRSTDETLRVAQEKAVTNPEIRIFSNPHRMTPHSFNIGLREARGQYVCIFGAHT